MRRAAKIYLSIMVLAAAAGYGASIAGLAEYLGSLGACDLGSLPLGVEASCEKVYSIPQAELFGVVHLSVAAPIYFTVLSLAVLWHWATRSTLSAKAVMAVSAAALPIIPYLVYLEVAVAEALCVWCTVMHVSIIMSFVSAAAGLRVSARGGGLPGSGV